MEQGFHFLSFIYLFMFLVLKRTSVIRCKTQPIHHCCGISWVSGIIESEKSNYPHTHNKNTIFSGIQESKSQEKMKKAFHFMQYFLNDPISKHSRVSRRRRFLRLTIYQHIFSLFCIELYSVTFFSFFFLFKKKNK